MIVRSSDAFLCSVIAILVIFIIRNYDPQNQHVVQTDLQSSNVQQNELKSRQVEQPNVQSKHVAENPAPPAQISARDVWNVHRISYDVALRNEFEAVLAAGDARNDDPRVLRLVTSTLEPPTTHYMRKTTHWIRQTPQAKAVDKLFKGQEGLFFVEAGALDGERSSNTLWLESKRKWEGLLVEVDPHFYTQLMGKARKAWTMHACLSGKTEKLALRECSGALGGCGSVAKSGNSRATTIPCFSLESLMLALNRTTIDYFSLDVEGHEYEVLNTIPWDRLTIKAITVEYQPPSPDQKEETIRKLEEYMKERGYRSAGVFNEKNDCREMYNRDVFFVREE